MLHFTAEKCLVTIYQTQIYHQETLIFELLIPSIESQRVPTDDSFGNEINDIMINWGKQELYNYCFISTYHLWEKQIGHIIRDQSKGKISSPRHDFVMSVKKILMNKFSVSAVSNEVWDYLEKGRIIVNAFKHGEGRSLEELKKIFPEVVTEDETDTHHTLIEIQENHVKDLIKSLKDFYEQLDSETQLDFSNWLSPTKG